MLSKITWEDKVSLSTDPSIDEENKITDDNMNQVKSVVNAAVDKLNGIGYSIQTENISCGSFAGGDEKYNQTYNVTIPQGSTCLGVVGWYLTGGGFTNLYINEIYFDSNKIHWSLKNGISSATASITLTVKLLLVKTQ